MTIEGLNPKNEGRVTLEELKQLESQPTLIHKGTIQGTTHDETVGMDFPVTLPETHLIIKDKNGKRIDLLV